MSGHRVFHLFFKISSALLCIPNPSITIHFCKITNGFYENDFDATEEGGEMLRGLEREGETRLWWEPPSSHFSFPGPMEIL